MALTGAEHPRNTGNIVRFFMVDARGILPFVPLLVFKSWTLFIVAVLTLIFFFTIERMGYTLSNFIRKVRTKISGPRKAVSHSMKRYVRY